jgi:hypothetical protein
MSLLPFKSLKSIIRVVEDSRSLHTLTTFSSKGLIEAFLNNIIRLLFYYH